ncbi:MAG: J domain-containing protein [Myxococcota bacterium]
MRIELAALANGMQGKDHFGVLGLRPGAGDDEIRASFADLAKRTHPDRFHGASSSVRHLAGQVFARISEAQAAIGTAEARAA